MSAKQTAEQVLKDIINLSPDGLYTDSHEHFAQDNTNNMNQQHANVTDLAVASVTTTNHNDHKRTAGQAFGPSFSDEQGDSATSAKVRKINSGTGEGSETGQVMVTPFRFDGSNDDEGEGSKEAKASDPVTVQGHNGAGSSSYPSMKSEEVVEHAQEWVEHSDSNNEASNDQVHAALGNGTQQQGPEPIAFDAAFANHAFTVLSILQRYINPAVSYPLTETFQTISDTVGGATRIPATINQAEFARALDDAQQGFEDLAVRKNQSITEMLGEEQELASIGLVQESMAIMASVSNTYHFLSIMRRDYEELNVM